MVFIGDIDSKKGLSDYERLADQHMNNLLPHASTKPISYVFHELK